MSAFNPKTYAAKIASQASADAADFLPRAAASHLMAAAGDLPFVPFRLEAVWPGSLADFRADLTRDEHIALAQAFASLALAPARAAA